MWQAAYCYLAYTSRSGLSLGLPEAPEILNDHPFPTPPGGADPTDLARGADLADDEVGMVDALSACLAWVLFVGQIVIWLVTILPGLIVDILTFPARSVLHYTVVAPLYSLFVASRRVLVMSGFLMPDT